VFLTAYNLPQYLMSKGLISAQSVVDGDFVLAEAGRRNRNFKVLRRKQPGLFVKQIKSTEAQAISTIEREAAFYRAVHSDPRYTAIAGMIPKFVDYEPSRRALALSLTENAESISEHHMRQAQIPENTARLIGNALGIAHSYGPAMMADPATRSLFPYQAPWPMTLEQMGYSFLDNFAPIGPQLSAAIQQLPKLQPMLSALRPLWQYDSLIHGDMKWDNCLVSSRDGVEMKVEDGSLRIRSTRTALAYVGRHAAALTDGDGFVDTGDMVELRGDRYHFVGRRGGIINIGGLKVHPEEIEAVINRHAEVRMSCAKSRRSPITGAIVVADVILADGSDPGRGGEIRDKILADCRASLASHKVPALIRFVSSLDMTSAGKLARHDA